VPDTRGSVPSPENGSSRTKLLNPNNIEYSIPIDLGIQKKFGEADKGRFAQPKYLS
jgi:hypothetical protein